MRRVLMGMALVALSLEIGAVPYEELVPDFDRVESSVMIRKVTRPTLAHLDYAAYDANPVRHDPRKYRPKPDGKVGISELTYGGALVDVHDAIEQTPLTEQERAHPMAWKPLENHLWELTKQQGFQSIANQIAGEKFGDRKVFQPFQEIAAVYLHKSGEQDYELWARVEFKPWVRFVKGIEDDDEDGFDEIYGRLVFEGVPDEKLAEAFRWMREEYTSKLLSREQIIDWINVLASYWYPTLNTDVVELGNENRFPTSRTEKSAVRQLDGLVVEDPVAVVRGNPFGDPIYNVYVVEGLAAVKRDEPAAAAAAGPKVLDTTTSANAKQNMQRFADELKAHGGSYVAWAKENESVLEGLQGILQQLPDGRMGFEGKGDWVFFRKSLEYLTAGDLSDQPREKNPLPHLVEFRDYLQEHKTNMLFVVVPTKAEIYYEKLPADMPDASDVVVNPYGRKLLHDAQQAGIEVIDLLPHLLEAKAADTSSEEHLYQHQDTHWTNRGLQISARLISERIKQYAWYDEMDSARVDFQVRDTTFSRQGDIVDKLPEDVRAEYPPVTLKAQRVYQPDGTPTRPNSATAPVMLIGDSFTGVFELVDCKSAGVGSHVAAKTGLPVDIITSWGGGPLVRRKMLRARSDELGHKRVVVYLMVARDLYNYAQSWEPLQKGK